MADASSSAASLKRPIADSYVVPGTHLAAGEYPGSPPSVAVAARDGRLGRFLDAGITAFVDLTSTADPLAAYAEHLLALAAERGLQVSHERLSIRDMDVCDADHMRRVLDTIDAHLAAGRATYVHCWGGVGRTGTVVGCWLVRQGRTGEEALAEVGRMFATMSSAKRRRHPEGSPQTTHQREMVLGWSERPADDTWAIHDVRVASAGRADLAPAGDALRAEAAQRPILSLLRAAMFGGAIGDALGWPVEFRTLGDIRAQFGPEGIQEFDPRVKGGLGAITDDTQMTLFTAEGLLRSTTRWTERECMNWPNSWRGLHVPNSDMMWMAYQRWLCTQQGLGRPRRHLNDGLGEPGGLLDEPRLYATRAPGNTCMSALRGGVQGSSRERINHGKGCGGVMRVAPIGLVPSEDPFAYAAMAAALTHGHPSGYLSAGAYAQILHALLFDRVPLPAAIELSLVRLARERGHEETSSALRAAVALASHSGEPTAERVESRGAGWTGEEALAIGVYCALVATDFAHGVRLAVNHSGDSDSTGSIAGALLGVMLGEDAIPAQWIAQVELGDLLGRVAEDLFIGYGGGPDWRHRYPGG